VFPEPEALLTSSPRILGIDGRKMSKSLNNYIALSDTREDIQKKVMAMFTDPEKIRRHDPGHPERCNVFTFHKAIANPQTEEIERDCRSGSLGCVACKRQLAELLADFIDRVTFLRTRYQGKEELIREILVEGSRKAREIARKTMEEVREAMKISYGIAR
jgi:tryptophanyl-tRNA synthetase